MDWTLLTQLNAAAAARMARGEPPGDELNRALPERRTEHRAFVIAHDRARGVLLLRAYKKKKGEHHQLPGGRVGRDEEQLAFCDGVARRISRSRSAEGGRSRTWSRGWLAC